MRWSPPFCPPLSSAPSISWAATSTPHFSARSPRRFRVRKGVRLFLRRPGNAQRLSQRLGVHHLAVAHDEFDLAQVADVLRRIAVDQREFRELAFGERAGLALELEHG